VRLAARPVGEEAGAFERDINVVGLVRKLRRVLLGCHMDALAVDDDVVAVGLDLAWELAVDAVVAEQPGVRLRIGKVVDADQLEPAVGPLEDGACDQAADSAEAVDCNSRHWIPLVFMKSSTRCVILSGVRPKKA